MKDFRRKINEIIYRSLIEEKRCMRNTAEKIAKAHINDRTIYVLAQCISRL